MLNGMTSQSVFYSNFLVAGLLDWYIFGAIWVVEQVAEISLI